jgi:integrase
MKTDRLKLGRHHFAFLRSIANGIDALESAKRFLGVDHGHELITASRNTINAVRAIGKRNDQKSVWRLIGLTIKPKAISEQPTLDDYVTMNDLGDWSESEVVEMYKEAYPPVSQSTNKHREKLRVKQIELLDSLEILSVQIPQSTDVVSGWFDDVLSSKFIGAGIVNIGDLQKAISRGGNWYANLGGVGESKAEKIISFLESICGKTEAPSKFDLVINESVSEIIQSPSTTLSASNDLEAVESWIRARAGSEKTATTYKREATRLLLWMKNKSFRNLQVEDCLDYMAFLQHIPDSWISKRHVKPFESGWSPFRGQLSHDSQKQSIVIVAALFHFLHQASYVSSNPWSLVNKKTGDDSKKVVKESRAISEFGFAEIIRYIDKQPISIQSERIRFIFKFLEAVGLRSMEFLSARLGHFDLQPEGLILYVAGKGAKNRYVFIPDQAREALTRYLDYRGRSMDDVDYPLLASTLRDDKPVGYQAFYQHVKSWLVSALRDSGLSEREKNRLHDCSPHWLRHTFGTRAVSRDVPMDAIQAQMGHASIQTTMNVYGRAPLLRRAEELGKAFK